MFSENSCFLYIVVFYDTSLKRVMSVSSVIGSYKRMSVSRVVSSCIDICRVIGSCTDINIRRVLGVSSVIGHVK